MPSRRERDLGYWLAPRQRSRLIKARARIQALLDELSTEADPLTARMMRALVERERAKLPPGGLSWPWWDELLREPVAGTAAGSRGVRQMTCPQCGETGEEMASRPLGENLPTLSQVLFAVLVCANGHVWSADRTIESPQVGHYRD